MQDPILKNVPLRPLLIATAVSLLAACAQPTSPLSGAATPMPGGAAPAPMSAGPAVATGPVAMARLLTPSGQPAGRVTLTTVQGGVHIATDAQGLKPGPHGYHVHMNGACASGPDAATGRIVDFGAAGGHFDPGVSRNHGAPGQPAHLAHAGELPVLQAGADGRAVSSYVNANVTVAPGKASVMGRTVVIHADTDDYVSDPAGNSGARVLCGLIEPAQPGIVTGRATLEGSEIYPEGIAIDPRTGHAYVGSTVKGDLFRIPAGSAKAELFQVGGSPGRQGAYGLKIDERSRLWSAGGPHGTLAMVDLASAATLLVLEAPQGTPTFVNDIALNRNGYAYVTDSFRPVIYRVRNPEPGTSTSLEAWLDLSATPIRYVPNEINLNGIVASPDGRWLLSIQTVTGQLWRIDTQTRAVSEVRIDGGELRNGDGLVLSGPDELLVLRNADNEIARVRLASGWASGRVEQRITDARLRYPSTAALSANGLMVVNAQLDKQKNPPPLLPFDTVTVRLPSN
jgi:Cu-Zn family superoxide dismutase